MKNEFFDETEWKTICDRGIVNIGNHYRISKTINKAREGKPINIGFIGGSITAGSLASLPETCYAYLVYRWWKEKFPGSHIGYVNAGIGATTSQYGVARVFGDLLRYEPDVVFVEFSVNDSTEDKYMETYEGLIRRILGHPKESAVIIINNVCYDNGSNAQEIHNRIGMYYDLPIVSIKDSIYTEVEKGRVKAESITPDNLHPNDRGHRLIADVIINFLESIYDRALHKQVIDEFYALPEKTLTKNRYINSVLYNNLNFQPELYGFKADTSKKEGLWDVFRQGWHAKDQGSNIRFSAECCGLSVLYRKYVRKEAENELFAPVARLVVDNNEDKAIILDARFDQDWGDYLYLHDIFKYDTPDKHTVDITVTDQAEGRDFYLAAIIMF